MGLVEFYTVSYKARISVIRSDLSKADEACPNLTRLVKLNKNVSKMSKLSVVHYLHSQLPIFDNLPTPKFAALC